MEPWGVVDMTVECVGGEEADTQPVLVSPQVFCERGDGNRMNDKKRFCLLFVFTLRWEHLQGFQP